MAEVIKLPALNPLQFHKASGGKFACDELPSFEEDKIYMQKFIRSSDSIAFQVQVHEDYISAIGFYIEDLQGNATTMTGSSLGVINGYENWHIHQDSLTTFADGVYFVVLEVTINMGAGDVVKKYVSEPVQMVSELPESLLIEYSHSRNEFDMAFYPDGTVDSKLTYYLRVEGGIPSDGFIPGSKDAYFIDQGRDVNLLDSTPYNVYKFTFGPKEGIPNWLANKINRILSLQEVVINDIQYTKNDGAKFEPIREKEYPFAGWQIEMVKVESEDSVVEIAVVTPTGLELTFDDIANVPVADASSVSDWNTFFDLPTNGTEFTSVSVTGNKVHLIGGSNINIKENLFFSNTHIIIIKDYDTIVSSSIKGINYCANLISVDLPIIVSVGNLFLGTCSNLTNINMPLLESSGDGLFEDLGSIDAINLPLLQSTGIGSFIRCYSIELINLPSVVDLGGTTGNNSVFSSITGQTITLTIPAALMTCNGGSPDGDIAYLQANNTVTIVTV